MHDIKCPHSADGVHSWYLMNDGLRAKCGHCKLLLDKDQTLEVYEKLLPKETK
jgi:hypothetical protein